MDELPEQQRPREIPPPIAVGVVSGTILSFEMGRLWPNFVATFGDVFGVAFGIEGFSFFAEAIFIAMYAYGWERFRPRRHLLLGVPIVIACPAARRRRAGGR